jgi:hypothetical protein
VHPIAWARIKNLPVSQKCWALAVLMSPYADSNNTLNDTPRKILHAIFGKELNTNPAIKLLREQGVLKNSNPTGGGRGVWTLHLPEGARRADAKDAAYQVMVDLAAQGIVDKLGPEAVPDVIRALQRQASQ